MKMAATWFRSARGLAIGTIVGALTVGKAMPYLVKAFRRRAWRGLYWGHRSGRCSEPRSWRSSTATGPFPLRGAGLVGARRAGGTPSRDAPGHGGLPGPHVGAVRHVGVGAGLPGRFERGGGPWSRLRGAGQLGALAAGGVGCVWGGWAADRIGRERLLVWAMGVSGLCCLVIGPLFGTGFALVAAVTLVWGFFVVADSAQFSALVTEVGRRGLLGPR